MLKQIFLFSFVILLISCLRSNGLYFEDFFGEKPDQEIENLEVYTEEVGANSSFWISFSCPDDKAEKFISNMNLNRATEIPNGPIGGLNEYPTEWWDTSFTHNAMPYAKVNDQVNSYLWHDIQNHKIYFLNHN